MENKRLVYMDVAKYWAIWLVLLAHTIQYNNMDNYELWKENILTRIIISFHMPLFMVISGFFFRSSLKRSLSDLMNQKIVQLLIPSVVFGTISYFSLSIPLSSWFKAIWVFGWYVKCLFSCYLGTWIIYKMADRGGKFILATWNMLNSHVAFQNARFMVFSQDVYLFCGRYPYKRQTYFFRVY